MIKELVAELIENAYKNGYGADIDDMTYEELAEDIFNSTDLEYDKFEEVLAAVRDYLMMVET